MVELYCATLKNLLISTASWINVIYFQILKGLWKIRGSYEDCTRYSCFTLSLVFGNEHLFIFAAICSALQYNAIQKLLKESQFDELYFKPELATNFGLGKICIYSPQCRRNWKIPHPQQHVGRLHVN